MLPFEAVIHLTAVILYTWLYLEIVIAPAAILGLVGLVALNFTHAEYALNFAAGMSLLGALIGVFWAERIRKKHGIIDFHGYILSTPEIEGWRDKDGKPVTRAKSQV